MSIKEETVDVKQEERVDEIKEKEINDNETKEKTIVDETIDKKKNKKKKENKDTLRISELEQDVSDLKEKLLRNAAELDNFKRRMNEEKIKDRKYATLGLCSKILEAIENFDRALNVPVEDEKQKNFLQGFKMIKDQIYSSLTNEGVEEIKALGEKYDPNFHQAVLTGSDESKEKEIILEEFQKGYKFKDRVIKPSMVKINE